MSNIVKATDNNVKAICKVMCECDFLQPDEVIHYAQIAGFKPEKDKAGNDYFRFNQKHTKATYLHELAKVLYIEPLSGDLDRAQVLKDFDFFLNSFGETSHTVMRYWSGLESVLMTTNPQAKYQDGLKGTGEST